MIIMLCQFTVKNFQCFKDEVTLDMQATNMTENEDSVFQDIDGERFLPLGVIYGPNGAGKSTILFALVSLMSKILLPIHALNKGSDEFYQNVRSTPIVPFKFSKKSIHEPTDFELFFRTSLREYQYKLSILKDQVIKEELYYKNLKGNRYTTAFIREKRNIELKGPWKEFNVKSISDNLPVLSYLVMTHGSNPMIQDISDYLQNGIQFVDYSDTDEESRIVIGLSDSLKQLMLQMFEEMDIDIKDYRIQKKENGHELFTTHVVDGEKYELELNEESSGTIKIFGILPRISKSIMNGTTLVIDELDSKVHPLLLKYLIRLYSDKEINKKKAQLIFTSHDLTTMNSENFRRDEIWFVAKGADQASNMVSLVEFKNQDGKTERKDARYDKRYLEGRYGADPYLKKIIHWGEM